MLQAEEPGAIGQGADPEPLIPVPSGQQFSAFLSLRPYNTAAQAVVIPQP